MRSMYGLLLGALGALSTPLAVASSVQVVGLFPNAAVILVEGERKLVRAGQTGPGGVQVLSADSEGAVLRINGQTQRVNLSREHSQGFAVPTKTEHRIARGAGGHYWVDGMVKGHTVRFLIDTGATTVAMNEAQARRLDIDFRQGQPAQVSTASGLATAWRVSLPELNVSGIRVLGVEAVVLEGAFPSEVLLGMSYLNRIRWREDEGVLVLESKL